MIHEKLFLDLDGVLVDLVLGVCRFLGKPWPYLDPKNFGQFSLTKVFGLDKSLWSDLSDEFWAGLDWTPDGREILQKCEDAYGRNNICILTAPTGYDDCIVGKLAWMRKHLPFYAARKQFFIGGVKDFAANPRACLVDDHAENTEAFIAQDGQAILVPRPWNNLHTRNIVDVPRYLEMQL